MPLPRDADHDTRLPVLLIRSYGEAQAVARRHPDLAPYSYCRVPLGKGKLIPGLHLQDAHEWVFVSQG